MSCFDFDVIRWFAKPLTKDEYCKFNSGFTENNIEYKQYKVAIMENKQYKVVITENKQYKVAIAYIIDK